METLGEQQRIYKYGVSCYTEANRIATKKYNQKPEIQEKRRNYQREYYRKKFEDPEYKEKITAYARESYHKRKLTKQTEALL